MQYLTVLMMGTYTTWSDTPDIMTGMLRDPSLSMNLQIKCLRRIFSQCITSCLAALRIKPKHERYDD